MSERQYNFPVWGTQGGGLVREVGEVYIFVEKPDCPGLDVGDTMPKEWGVIPANETAQRAVSEAEGLDEDYSELEEKVAAVLAAAETDDLAELISLVGLDPSSDLAGQDWAKVDFGEADVTDWDLGGCNLDGADMSRVKNIELAHFDCQTSCVGTKFPNGYPPLLTAR